MEQQEEQKEEITITKQALFVEDYEPSQRYMSIYLQNLGYQIDLVDDSFTAIENVQTKTYDLIIEDINLHGIKVGKKIIQEIRESELNVGTPLIVWAAYTDKNDEEIYLAWGADGALKKNCGIEGLKKSIQQCLLTPRYERKYRFKLKILQTNWQDDPPAEWMKKINDLRHLPYSILNKALYAIGEYKQWSEFHAEE